MFSVYYPDKKTNKKISYSECDINLIKLMQFILLMTK